MVCSQANYAAAIDRQTAEFHARENRIVFWKIERVLACLIIYEHFDQCLSWMY